MRALLRALAHPLTWLLAALGWNWYRGEHDMSTICVVTRRWVPWPVMVAVGLLFNGWFWPHWLRPLFAGRRA